MAKVLLGCFRTGEANDPEIYSGAVIAVLSSYSAEVVRRVVDPRTGLPSRCKWLPTIAEIREACDAEAARIQRDVDRDDRVRRQLLAPPEEPREARPTYDELRARCAADGLFIGKPCPPSLASRDAAALRERCGITEAQWDAIPNSPLIP